MHADRLQNDCCIESIEKERIPSVVTARSDGRSYTFEDLKAACQNKTQSTSLQSIDF